MSVEVTLAHPEVQRIASALAGGEPRVGERPDGTVAAAVAVVIRARSASEPAELLLILRAEHEADKWSGQMAFPGGRHEEGDENLAATSARETWEETGVDLRAQGRMMGQLDDVWPITPGATRFRVRPFVWAVSPDVSVVAGAEVADHFWASLDTVLDRGRWMETDVDAGGSVRRTLATAHEGNLIWGMTFRILVQLRQRLDS